MATMATMSGAGVVRGSARLVAPRGARPSIAASASAGAPAPAPREAPPSTSGRAEAPCTRSGLLRAAGAALAAGALAGAPPPPPAAAAAGKGARQTRVASDFCPPAETPGFSLYQPSGTATPAIRAGVIKEPFYRFDVPSDWSEGTILNILSGNFCMPRCDEPWYEAVFESRAEGRMQLIAFPLRKLISKAGAALKDLGPPEQLAERIGPYITGNDIDVESDVVSAAPRGAAYAYEVNAPQAKDGLARAVAVFAIRADVAYLIVAAADEKQWARSEKKLRHIVDSFAA